MVHESGSCLRFRFAYLAVSILFLVSALPAWAQTYKIVYGFSAANKLSAGSVLLRDKMGNLYGASPSSPRVCPGGSDCGAIYKISATGRETTLYEFKGRPDGAFPVGITIDAYGTLYGTTSYGGNGTYCSDGCGTVFSLTTSGKETVLHSFQEPPSDGVIPAAGVTVYPNGVVYGTTYYGGNGNSHGVPAGDGTIYELTPGNHLVKILQNFTGGYDGGFPAGDLLLVGATLYGTTVFGGFGPCHTTFGPGCGTVFKYDANGLTELYEFQDGPDGANPAGALIIDSQGNLYGSAVLGGDPNHCPGGGGVPPGCGVVFKVTPDGHEMVLHTFSGTTDGMWPSAALAMDAAGNIYGTAYFGGDLKCADGNGYGCGTLFKIDASGNFSVIHTFHGTDGALPMAIIAGDGKLYGVTNSGGPANRGVVYELKP